ncbi:MAG: class IV adenylate cyclase [Planctomycetes bacterium]|nr:class IV adenylate cyclase [Planctomycetota bacterium]
MSSNVEIKARYADLTKARRIAVELGAEMLACEHQIDTYFHVKSGRLKLRESSACGAHLIPYCRPDQTGPKRSDYEIIAIANPVRIREMLSEILSVLATVDKVREIYLLDRTRIHLDDVKDLGTFIEFEAMLAEGETGQEGHERVDRLLSAFDIAPADLLEGSYSDLIRRSAHH